MNDVRETGCLFKENGGVGFSRSGTEEDWSYFTEQFDKVTESLTRTDVLL